MKHNRGSEGRGTELDKQGAPRGKEGRKEGRGS